MLSLATELRIADMLDAGNSRHYIAKACHVSTATVNAIKTGKRAQHLSRTAQDIKFRTLARSRVCVGCSLVARHQVSITVSPCPACLARRQS